MTEFPGPDALLATQSMRQFAFLAGISPMTARKIALRRLAENIPDENGQLRGYKTTGADGKVRPARRYDTLARDAKIVALRQDGQSIRAIAATADCSVGTVHRVLAANPAAPEPVEPGPVAVIVRDTDDGPTYWAGNGTAFGPEPVRTFTSETAAKMAWRAETGRQFRRSPRLMTREIPQP